jgi:transcriptional regulator with XRE-family HTH domain
MTMGEYIKYLRCGGNVYGKKWSQAELGKLMNPPVYRSAVNKWETGLVINIKRDYIEQMSKLFGITPNELMCFESRFDEEQISEEVKVIEQINKYFGAGAVQLLQYFTELNDAGKQKALNDVGDLTEIPKYMKG